MPQSIPAGLKPEHILRALADLDVGNEHPFGPSTGYELLHEGKRYAPKAVVGLACRYSIGRILLPGEFSEGEAPGQANFGFIRKIGGCASSGLSDEFPLSCDVRRQRVFRFINPQRN
jgi:hypothetical protein